MKLAIVLLVSVVAGVVALVASRSPAVEVRPGAQAAAGYDARLDEFWRRWENERPSEAVRRAAPTPELQRAWAPAGRIADDFQSRWGGKSLGHTEINRKAIGERMAYVSFFALYEPVPLRVRMLCYRAREEWSIVSLHVDSAPHRWMDEVNRTLVIEATDGRGEDQQDDPVE